MRTSTGPQRTISTPSWQWNITAKRCVIPAATAISARCKKPSIDNRGIALEAWTLVNLGASYKLTPQLTLNSTVNNLLDKDFSGVDLYRVGNSSTYTVDYFQTQASTNGYVTLGHNYWLSLNYTF